MTSTIDREFSESLLRTFDDPNGYGVHLLFNEFWRHAPVEVVDKYVTQFSSEEDLARFVAEGYFAEPLTLDRLLQSPPASLGAEAHTFITHNGLEQNLATNYREFHSGLERAGLLDAMPEPLRYAVLRGFQLHDLLHVVTGYGPSPRDEIALQAFCLAQLQFPYFAMWVSVITTRMTFIDPDSIVPLMDAITEGWQFGRGGKSIQITRWEDRLSLPLSAIRQEYGIASEGRSALATKP